MRSRANKHIIHRGLFIYTGYNCVYIRTLLPVDYDKKFEENSLTLYFHESMSRCFNNAWWHHVEMLSILLVFCEGNPPVTGGFPTQKTSSKEAPRLNIISRANKHITHKGLFIYLIQLCVYNEIAPNWLNLIWKELLYRSWNLPINNFTLYIIIMNNIFMMLASTVKN